jgi:hypothetical protein
MGEKGKRRKGEKGKRLKGKFDMIDGYCSLLTAYCLLYK